MRQKQDDHMTKLISAAESAIAKLEELKLGRDHAESLEAATSAIDALREESAIGMFPPHLAAVSDAPLRDFQMAVELMGRDNIAELAELHSQAIAGENEQLAAIVRSPRGVRRVELAARAAATPMHRLETHAAAEERAVPKAANRFKRKIAEQLFEHKQFMPASEILSVVIPELEGQLVAASARHETHHREKAEEAAAALAHRREELAQRFHALRNNGFTFVVLGVSQADRFNRLDRYSPAETSRFIADGRCDGAFGELEKQLLDAERAIGVEHATA